MSSRSIYIRVASRDLTLASVRYRGLLPGCALCSLGWRVQVGTGDDLPPAGTAAVMAVKPLSARDAHWVRQVVEAGTPVIADLCDNIFIGDYAGQGTIVGDRFAGSCIGLAAITVPTDALRDVVLAKTGLAPERVSVVPDIIETPALLLRQREFLGQKSDLLGYIGRRLRRLPSPQPANGPVLLWFGNHGASYANFGLQDLLLFGDALREASHRAGAELWVVSNNRDKFDQIATELPIASRYFEWAPETVDALLPAVDVCLVPNSRDPFSLTKSANRAIKALSHRVPVVATPTSAYSDLMEAVWLGDPTQGVMAYLDDLQVRQLHLDAARQILEQRYSFAALRRNMNKVVSVVDGVRQ